MVCNQGNAQTLDGSPNRPPQKDLWVDSRSQYAQAFAFNKLPTVKLGPGFGREIHACCALPRNDRCTIGSQPLAPRSKEEYYRGAFSNKHRRRRVLDSGGEASMRTARFESPSGCPAPPIRPESTHRFPRRAERKSESGSGPDTFPSLLFSCPSPGAPGFVVRQSGGLNPGGRPDTPRRLCAA